MPTKAQLEAEIAALKAANPQPEATLTDQIAAAVAAALSNVTPEAKPKQAEPTTTRLESATVREAVTNVQTGEVNPGDAQFRLSTFKGYVTCQPLLKDGSPRVGGAKSSRPGEPTGGKRWPSRVVRAIREMSDAEFSALIDCDPEDNGSRAVASLD